MSMEKTSFELKFLALEQSCNTVTFSYGKHSLSQSKWPHGQSHELPSPARMLNSWVRIPPEAWMPVCVYSVFVLSCAVGGGAAAD
jgi:hypothetical protein